MSSKKKRKEKQQSRIMQDKLRAMKRTLDKKNIAPFELEEWMGHSSHTYYSLHDVYTALEFEDTVQHAHLIGRAIGCPSSITILNFNNDNVQYELDGDIHVGNTKDYLVEINT